MEHNIIEDLEPFVILDFTKKHTSIHLNLDNKFTLDAFIKIFKENEYFYAIDKYINKFHYNTTFKLIFVGNCGNIEVEITLESYNELLFDLRKVSYERCR